MNILIVHGIGGKAGIHWQQWLYDALTADGHDLIMPTLSRPDHPDRQTWLAEITAHVANLSSNTMIIGHSLGVTSALDYIEGAVQPIKALICVSGFAVPLGTELNEYFMQEKAIDFSKVRSNVGQARVLYGDDDPYVNQPALLSLATELHVEPTIIHHGGHLNTDAGYIQFPKLLNEIKSVIAGS